MATTSKDTRWYIIHTYSGQEERVKKNLDLRIQSLDMQHKIFQVVVPTEEEIVLKDGQAQALESARRCSTGTSWCR